MHDPVYVETYKGHVIKIYHDPEAAALCGGYTASGQLVLSLRGSFLGADTGSIFGAD